MAKMLNNTRRRKLSHNWLKIFITVLAIVVYVAYLILNGFGWFGYNSKKHFK